MECRAKAVDFTSTACEVDVRLFKLFVAASKLDPYRSRVYDSAGAQGLSIMTLPPSASSSRLFPGDSADLTEHVARIQLEERFHGSLSRANSNGTPSTETEVSSIRSKHCTASQDAAELISKAKHARRKQMVLDTYLDTKIIPSQSPAANSARVKQKLEQLSARLSSAEDSQHVLQRGQRVLQHMPSLCHQKLKRSTYVPGSAAARVAYQAEQAYQSQDGLLIVIKHMQEALHVKQGPRARRGAALSACTDVIAELAFPQPPDWQAQLNAFIDHNSKHATEGSPGLRCKKAACQLNLCHALPGRARAIADSYFFDKIVTHWNVGANQGHMKDKLLPLLPLISGTDVRAQVQAAADAYVRNMSDLRSNKKMHESHRRMMRRNVPACG